MIKYVIPRDEPAKDKYLVLILQHVDASQLVCGIGEQSAIVNIHKFKIPGFTIGIGCVQSHLSNRLFEACNFEDYKIAETLREN